jgi:hypothetical protein
MKAIICFLFVGVLAVNAKFRPIVAISDMQFDSSEEQLANDLTSYWEDKALDGTTAGLAKSAFNDGEELGDAYNSWKNADLSTGSGVYNALRTTAGAFSDSFNTLNGATGGALQDAVVKGVEYVAGGAFPEAALAVEAGKVAINLYGHSQDLTNEFSGLYHGFANRNVDQVADSGLKLFQTIGGAL